MFHSREKNSLVSPMESFGDRDEVGSCSWMMAHPEYNEEKLSDSDASYDLVNWEEFGVSLSETEDSSAENENSSNEIESDTGSDVEFPMFESSGDPSCYRTVAFQGGVGNMFESPSNIMRSAEMVMKEIVKFYVLPFLPAKSLTRFKAVSKDWNEWISTPFLAHKQSYLHREKSGFLCLQDSGSWTFMTLDEDAYGAPTPFLDFLPMSVVLVSSCNGLLLCRDEDAENLYYVCNPVRKEWRAIPQPDYYHCPSSSSIILAFEPSELNVAADFELICAFPRPDVSLPDVSLIFFEIYSSETNSWKSPVENFVGLEHPVTLKGGFYMENMAYFETNEGKIIHFDMKNEISGFLDLPATCPPDGALVQLRGELCYVRVHTQTGTGCTIDIHGGMDMGLKQSVGLRLDVAGAGQSFRVLPSLKDDSVVFRIGGVVYCYHLWDQKVEVLSRRERLWLNKYLPYVNSLVSVAS